jgi:autotransporter translocation and assembly factor TamB
VIGVGAGPAAFGEQTRQLLTAGLGSLVARPLEQVLAAGLGLAEFSVEFGVAEPVRVRVGQYLVDRLYLAYARSVTGSTPTWLWRATYEITPSFWLGFSVNERQEQRFELQSVFRF